MNNELFQLLLSLRLGDGSFITQNKTENKNYHVITSSINKDYIEYKRNVLEQNGIFVRSMKCSSGYKKSSQIFGISTRISKEISIVGNLSITDCINNLDMTGLIMLYLDDGSLHKNKHTMHLYCNSFKDGDVLALVEKIHELLPQKSVSVYFDRKRDGRVFPYLYFPRCVVDTLNIYVRDFLIQNNINSLLYKTFLPSQTVESISN